MEDIQLLLPFPPTVNSYWSKTRNGIYLSNVGRLYKQSVLNYVIEQLPGVELDGKLNVEVTLFPPDARTRDLDNYMKGLLDAITESGLWEDDSYIDQLHVMRGKIVKRGLVMVEVNDAGPIVPLPPWIEKMI